MELVFLRFLMLGAFTWITASVAACGENSYSKECAYFMVDFKL